VIDALDIGGAQELLVLIAGKAPKFLFQTLVCVIQPVTTLKPRIESKEVPVYCFNMSRPSTYNPFDFILYFYKNVREIHSLCRQNKVDVVHCPLLDSEFIGIPAGWLYPADRVISTVLQEECLPGCISAV
jgi:hypothetical protein